MAGTRQTRSRDGAAAGGRAGQNRRLPAQMRKQLRKHYINKYRAVKRGAQAGK